MRNDVSRFRADRSSDNCEQEAEPFNLCFQGLPGSSSLKKFQFQFARPMSSLDQQ